MREDASFAAFYLIALALGVLLVSTHGSNLDLLHLLFGSILAVDNMALILMGGIATSSLLLLAVIYRPSSSSASIPASCGLSAVAAGSSTRCFWHSSSSTSSQGFKRSAR